MYAQQPQKLSRLRYLIVIVIFTCILLTVLARVIYLSVYTQNFLRQQGDARTMRVIDMHAHRGMITDRNGKPLAVSTPVTSIWIDPKQFTAADDVIHTLAKALDLPAQELIARIHQARAQSKEFIYLKRQINPAQAKKIETMALEGLYTREEYRRFYPEGEATAHILGFTDIDDQGQEGLELAYDEWLRGIPGKKQVIKDRLGRVVSNLKILQVPRAGRNLMLSIDRRIQYLAYTKLRDAMSEFQAQSGSVVVLDSRTGEVLAMVNYPSYNPNVRKRVHNDKIRNRAVTDTFEPGSLIKPFSVANALMSRQYTPQTMIDTHPGYMAINRKLIHDIHNYGTLDVESVLTRSSNIGVAKMTLSLPADKLPKMLSDVGFGETTGSGFPGEVPGKLDMSASKSQIGLATLSFGYGMTSTPIQLAQAFSLFANQGQKFPLSLLRTDKLPVPTQVLPKEIAQTLLAMLEKVVSTPLGTAKSAQLNMYRVGGKTGTSRIVGDSGYEAKRHNAFFAGIAPISNPRLVIVTFIHDPQGKQYYAGQIAAPLFAEIMQESLQLLKVPPDKAPATP